jgi:hypothetical protein
MRCGGVIYMNALYPLVEFAHKIGKNTAEFTTIDMVNFTKWWMKQPNRVQVESQIKEQLGRASTIHNQNQSDKKEFGNMTKKSTTQAFQNAQKSRLTANQIEEVEIDMDAELEKVNAKIEENDIVCDMGLTRGDVTALLFAISRVFEDYDMEGHEYGESLASLKEALEGV